MSYMLPYGYCTYSQNILVDNSGVYLYSTCVPTCSQRCEPNSTTALRLSRIYAALHTRSITLCITVQRNNPHTLLVLS